MDNSPFHTLSAELRLAIYEAAFDDNQAAEAATALQRRVIGFAKQLKRLRIFGDELGAERLEAAHPDLKAQLFQAAVRPPRITAAAPSPGLATACKALRNECLPTLHAQATFHYMPTFRGPHSHSVDVLSEPNMTCRQRLCLRDLKDWHRSSPERRIKAIHITLPELQLPENHYWDWFKSTVAVVVGLARSNPNVFYMLHLPVVHHVASIPSERICTMIYLPMTSAALRAYRSSMLAGEGKALVQQQKAGVISLQHYGIEQGKLHT